MSANTNITLHNAVYHNDEKKGMHQSSDIVQQPIFVI